MRVPLTHHLVILNLSGDGTPQRLNSTRALHRCAARRLMSTGIPDDDAIEFAEVYEVESTLRSTIGFLLHLQ